MTDVKIISATRYEQVETTFHPTFEAADAARAELRKKHKISTKETVGALHRVRVYRRKADNTFRTVLKLLKTKGEEPVT